MFDNFVSYFIYSFFFIKLWFALYWASVENHAEKKFEAAIEIAVKGDNQSSFKSKDLLLFIQNIIAVAQGRESRGIEINESRHICWCLNEISLARAKP